MTTPPKRIGDRIADVARRLGFAPCAPCRARQAALNAAEERARQIARDALARDRGQKP